MANTHRELLKDVVLAPLGAFDEFGVNNHSISYKPQNISRDYFNSLPVSYTLVSGATTTDKGTTVLTNGMIISDTSDLYGAYFFLSDDVDSQSQFGFIDDDGSGFYFSYSNGNLSIGLAQQSGIGEELLTEAGEPLLTEAGEPLLTEQGAGGLDIISKAILDGDEFDITTINGFGLIKEPNRMSVTFLIYNKGIEAFAPIERLKTSTNRPIVSNYDMKLRFATDKNMAISSVTRVGN